MKPQDRQWINWVSAACIIITILAYFIGGWVDSVIILAGLGIFIGLMISPKLVMFIVYHTVLFGFVGYILVSFWLPLFENQWHWMVNWLRILCLILTYMALAAGAVASILSCWTNKALTETQIGQWTFGGWMPEWGKNMKNRWYGVFTGLPAGMVKVIAKENVSVTVKDKKPIQIEIEGDPDKKKFEAEFDFSYMYIVGDTHKSITNKSEVTDLTNLVIKALTGYLNDPSNKYKEIGKLKLEIAKIQLHIQTELGESICLYGIEVFNFKLIDIEIPKKQIDQQIADAAAMRAQDESDARELKDTQALDAQVQAVMKAAKDANSPITYEKAVEIVQVQRKLIQRTAITGDAKPVVITGTGGGGKKSKNSPP